MVKYRKMLHMHVIHVAMSVCPAVCPPSQKLLDILRQNLKTFMATRELIGTVFGDPLTFSVLLQQVTFQLKSISANGIKKEYCKIMT